MTRRGIKDVSVEREGDESVYVQDYHSEHKDKKEGIAWKRSVSLLYCYIKHITLFVQRSCIALQVELAGHAPLAKG